MLMPRTPERQFPGAWPDSPLPACHVPTVSSQNKSSLVIDSPSLPPRFSSPVLQNMDHRASLLSDSLEELHRPLPSPSAGSVAHLAKKPPLRIIVPPTEYCPFSTDLTLPITPLSLPTPVSSSCFTFSDRQELANQSTSASITTAPVPPSCPQDTPVVDFASPTSSQFLLMPPTSHLEDTDAVTPIRVSLLTPATDEPTRCTSIGIKSENPRPWEVSSSTWLSDLGGYTETDRIFRHNLLAITSVDTDTSPASTPALSPSVVSPSSQVLAYNSPISGAPAGSPTSLPPALSPYPCMSPQSSPARLALKPMGTDTFPSALDGLQAWRESVIPGIPQSSEPHSPFSEDVPNSQAGEHMPQTSTVYPFSAPRQHPRHPSSHASRVSKSQSFIKHAKAFGGRVKQFVARQRVNKHRGSMDRGVSFRVVTSQDSENGSVILITAPPPPYGARPPTLAPHGTTTGEEHMRSRSISEYSSAVQTSTVELSTTGMAESGSRRGGNNRNALRRLSLAALSTMNRF